MHVFGENDCIQSDICDHRTARRQHRKQLQVHWALRIHMSLHRSTCSVALWRGLAARWGRRWYEDDVVNAAILGRRDRYIDGGGRTDRRPDGGGGGGGVVLRTVSLSEMRS